MAERHDPVVQAEAQEESAEPAKLSYSRPELIVHGTIEDLTAGVIAGTGGADIANISGAP